jgi:hypothetical protein
MNDETTDLKEATPEAEPEKAKEPEYDPNTAVHDLVLRNEPFKVRGKDGVVTTFIIWELTGPERDAYMSDSAKKSRFTETGKFAGFKDFKGSESDLLCRCVKLENGQRLTDSVFASWPARVQSIAYERACILSGFDKKAKEAAKKE